MARRYRVTVGAVDLGGGGGDGVGTTAAVAHGGELTELHVGPWAPQGVAKGEESLVAISPQSGFAFRMSSDLGHLSDGGSAWPPDAHDGNPEVLNDPGLLGGVVTGSPVTIDGHEIPVGTYICQWRDFSSLDLYADGATYQVMFRGCRFRSASGGSDVGLVNDSTAGSTSSMYFHYCDIGYTTADPADGTIYHMTTKFVGGRNHRVLRCYATTNSTFFQPNVSGCQIIENYIDDFVFFYGEAGTSGGFDSSVGHMNGISIEGGLSTLTISRNKVLCPSPDRATGSTGSAAGQIGYGTQPGQQGYGSGTNAGRTILQTDCIALFTSNGTSWAGATNVQVRDNYLAGAGVCLYAGGSLGTPANLKITGNRFSTRYWTNGGDGGPVTDLHASQVAQTNGNEWSDNLWADDYGTGGDGHTPTSERQYPLGDGPRAGTAVA